MDGSGEGGIRYARAAGWALRKVPGWGTCHRLLPRRGAQREPRPEDARRRVLLRSPADSERRREAGRAGPPPPRAPSEPAPRARHSAVTDTAGVEPRTGVTPDTGLGARPPLGLPSRSRNHLRTAEPAPGPCSGAFRRAEGWMTTAAVSSAGTEPHGRRSWRADSIPRRLFNGLLLGRVSPGADPTELAYTGICQTPSADTLWSDLLC